MQQIPLPAELQYLQLLGDYQRNGTLIHPNHLVFQRLQQSLGTASMLAVMIEVACDKHNDFMNALRAHHSHKVRWDPSIDMVPYLGPFCQLHSVLHGAMLLSLINKYLSEQVKTKITQLAAKHEETGKLLNSVGLDKDTATELLILAGRQVISQELCCLGFIFPHQGDSPFQTHQDKFSGQASPKN